MRQNLRSGSSKTRSAQESITVSCLLWGSSLLVRRPWAPGRKRAGRRASRLPVGRRSWGPGGRPPKGANHRVRFYFANVMDQWRMMVEDGEVLSVCTPSVPLDSTVANWCTFSDITATVLSWVLQTYRSGERICGRDAKVRSECQRIMS